jgi:hypothetical protein
VASASDIFLIHFNSTVLSEIRSRVEALRSYGKPIICNEDNKTESAAASAAAISVTNGASYRLMLREQNQFHPFQFAGGADDPIVYERMRELTTTSVNSLPIPSGNELISLQLIDSDGGQIVGKLGDGYIIDFAVLGTSNVNILAETLPTTVGSIQFEINDLAGTPVIRKIRNRPPYVLFRKFENKSRYALAGVSSDIDFDDWRLAPGNYRITVTPYSRPDAGGTPGVSMAVDVTVQYIAR